MALLITLHVLSAVVWVGGMFFAYVILRPSVGPLEPPVRLALWHRVFQKFLPWVGLSVVLLLVSGYAIIFGYYPSWTGTPHYIYLMQVTGIVMMLLYLHLIFGPWRRFSRVVGEGAFAEAAGQLNKIRHIVAVNLALGLITVIVGASGRYW